MLTWIAVALLGALTGLTGPGWVVAGRAGSAAGAALAVIRQRGRRALARAVSSRRGPALSPEPA